MSSVTRTHRIRDRWPRLRAALAVGLAFLLAGPLHTLMHETAHLVCARAYGWQARLAHDGTRIDSAVVRRMQVLEQADPSGREYAGLREKRLVVLAAGLLANTVVSLLGLFALAVRLRRPFRRCIDLPAAIAAMSAVVLVLAGMQALRPNDLGDLDRLAELLRWPEAPLEVVTGLLGVSLCALTVLLYREDRWRVFVPAALVGGEIGYLLWDYLLAPQFLP